MRDALNALRHPRHLVATSRSSRRCCGIRAFAQGDFTPASSPRSSRTAFARRRSRPSDRDFLAARRGRRASPPTATRRGHRGAGRRATSCASARTSSSSRSTPPASGARRRSTCASTAATTVTVAGRTRRSRRAWRFGEILLSRHVNGAPFAVQVERRGRRCAVAHDGARIDVRVMTRARRRALTR